MLPPQRYFFFQNGSNWKECSDWHLHNQAGYSFLREITEGGQHNMIRLSENFEVELVRLRRRGLYEATHVLLQSGRSCILIGLTLS
jgi:hypothetical protein